MSVHLACFTNAERRLLEAWKQLIEDGEHENLDGKAAMRLGLSVNTVQKRKSRMRTKYYGVKSFMAEYRSFQQFFFQKTSGKFNPLSVSGRAVKK